MVSFMYHDETYEVPANEPLTRIYLPTEIKKKNVKMIRAFDRHWIETNRPYPAYVPHTSASNSILYLRKNLRFKNELLRLLAMRYHEFICYVAYEPKVSLMLKSFFKHAVCEYEMPSSFVGPQYDMYGELRNNVVVVYLRMFQDDDPIQFMEKKELYGYLKQANVIDFTTVVDICRLYGDNHVAMVNDITSVYFDLEPTKFKEEAVSFFRYAVQDRLLEIDYERPVRWIVVEIVQIVHTLSCFLRYYPFGNYLICQFGLIQKLWRVYKRIPGLCDRLADGVGNMLYKSYVLVIRKRICKIYHDYVERLYDELIKTLLFDVHFPAVYKFWKLAKEENNTFYSDYCILYNKDRQVEPFVTLYDEIGGSGFQCEIAEMRRSLVKNQNVDSLSLKLPVPEVKVSKDECFQAVKETFPQLDDEFIHECMDTFGCNPQKVINAILENEHKKSKQQSSTKKGKYYDTMDMLGDKSFVREMKQRNDNCFLYGMINDPSMDDDDDDGDNVYNDDYDDSYDSRPILINEPRLEIEEDSSTSDPLELNSDSDEANRGRGNDDNKSTKMKAFCEDPAVLRARREERMANKVYGGGAGGHKNVVGKPKGQGQEKKVKDSRDNKSVNKSSRGNHNRRRGAQFKRNRGMIPS